MSTVKKDQTELGGMLGESVSVRKVAGRVILKNLPQRKMTTSSPGQDKVKENLLKASLYAKGEMEDPAMKALYATGITKKKQSPYVVAVRDYLIAPKVSEIKTANYGGVVGDIISIDAIDDFKVARVQVTITDGNGNRIERGEAVQVKSSSLWKYTATVANPSLSGTVISATAFDLPENEATLEKVLE